MVQIMLLWNSENEKDTKLAERLKKGFDKIGCWSCQLPPAGSIYKIVLAYEGEDLKKEDK